MAVPEPYDRVQEGLFAPAEGSAGARCSSCGAAFDPEGVPATGRLRCLKCGGEIRPAGEPGPAARIGKYAIRRRIARGGMGTVYEAEDPELKRRVALKVLREGDADPKVLARFPREAAIAAQLQHPNI